MQFNNDFQYDLKVGRLAEKNLNRLLSSKKIEVKLDRWCQVTGNIAVEFTNKGKPSGIAKTSADYWCFVVEIKGNQDLMVMVDTAKLRKSCRLHWELGHVKLMGDNNQSEAVLIPVRELVPTLIKVS
jgi:hypothetical protein